MEEETKRMRALAFILIMIVILASGFFMWSFINRGTINFMGDAPFIIEDYDGKIYECESSPCKIKMKASYQNLKFYKEGFDNIYGSIDLGIFDEIDFEVDFAIIAAVTTAESLPTVNTKNYALLFDENRNMQKLVESDDEDERPIVYFKRTIDNPIVISSNDHAIVIDDKDSNSEFYKVDIRSKARKGIDNEDLITIIDGKISLDGRYLVFNKSNSDYLWILDTETNEATESIIMTGINNVDWDYLNRLIFVTDQKHSTNSLSAEYTGDIILSSEKSNESYLFAYYLIEENGYYSILNFDEISNSPTDFIMTKNGKIIYFSADGQNFKIILDKI